MLTEQTVLIQSDTLGGPDQDLGRILMGNCLRLMNSQERLPRHIILLNAGVKLAVSGAETAEHLNALIEKGVKMISCRTCVDYFGVEEQLAAGEIDGMAAILEILSAGPVLTLG